MSGGKDALKVGAGGSERLPLGLNRFTLLSLVCLICFLNGPVVLNWPPLRKQLIHAGVYSNRCSPSDEPFEEGACNEQLKAIALLGTLGQTLMFGGSVLGGLIVDTLGPRIGCLIGCGMFTLQHMFILISSSHGVSVELYIPAYMLAGLGIEVTFFGILSTANLFPNNRSLVLSVMGTFRSLSMGYSLFQQHMVTSDKLSLRNVSVICMIVAILCGVLSSAVLPSKLFHVRREEEKDHKRRKKDKEEQTVVVEQLSIAEAGLSGPQATHSQLEEEEPQQQQPTWKQDLKEAGRAAIRPSYIIWLLFFVIAYARATFYTVTISDQHPDVITLFSILSPLSFIPCPILGFLADTIGIDWVLLILTICGTILYTCLLSGSSLAAQYIAAFVSCIILSFVASQNYCYIVAAYKTELVSKLAGFALTAAGLLSLVNTPMYNSAVDGGTFKVVNSVYLGLTLASFLALPLLRRKLAKSSTSSSIGER